MESTHDDRPGQGTVDGDHDEVQPNPQPPTPSYSSVQGLHPPPPTPISSSSSQLATALHPPRGYNPYPYPRTWRLWRWLVGEELEKWRYREDLWMKLVVGQRNYSLEYQPAPPVFSGTPPPEQLAEDEDPEDPIDRRFELEFMTVDQQKGLPLKTLLSPRRVIERTMLDAKKKVFLGYHQDNIWVRIKWPAYPDHEPTRSILVTFRSCKQGRRRPCTRLELSVALAGLISRYYDEVAKMDPHPAFSHLALGGGENRLSLYALRMTALRASRNGIYDIELELEPRQEVEDTKLRNGLEYTSGLLAEPDGVRYHVPPWPSMLPVPCTVGPPPKLSLFQYFTHVDPIGMSNHTMPTWQEPK
ncbi:hypothetical protein C8Q74DRAFT_1225536 [Fomes fomentarius]|nr:hypothetical protein C8Q74DRAFT_1225536 [Fomes fomentarius]